MRQRMLLGLIGANIMGSLSPALFADAFAAAGIEGFYHLIDVDGLREKRLPKLLDAIKAAGFAGANITYPFKQDVIALLDTIDPEAAQTGAVNTVAIGPDGRTTGYNFDRRGWRRSFAETLGRDSAQAATVLLFGAGGAGRAVAFALMDLGVALIVVHDRDGTRAIPVRDDVPAPGPGAEPLPPGALHTTYDHMISRTLIWVMCKTCQLRRTRNGKLATRFEGLVLWSARSGSEHCRQVICSPLRVCDLCATRSRARSASGQS